jgi:hypothetical protein
VLPAEVGPEHVGEVQLGVGQLPEQVVGQAVLPRGADQEVRVGHVGQVEVAGQCLLVDPGGVQAPPGDVDGQGPGGVDQLGPSAVVEGDDERHLPVPPGELHGFVHPALHPGRDPPAPPAGEADPHAPLVELVSAAQEQVLVEVHEVPDLVQRPAPVLGGEGIGGEVLHAHLERAFHGVEERLLPGGVAIGALEALALGPPPVAVHDHRDVTGDTVGVEAGDHRWVTLVKRRRSRTRPA